MTAPAGLTRLAPPPSLLSPAPSATLSPAPSATLSPPLSEPDQQRSAEAGGRLSFFGRDGHVLLELSHGAAEAWERPDRWVAVSKKTFWPSVTVTAPVGAIGAHHASGQLSQPGPGRRASRKQPTPGRRPAGALLCRVRRTRPPPAGGTVATCPRRLGRRPCGAAWPAAVPPAPPAAGPSRGRHPRLADAVLRLAERRDQSSAARPQRAVTPRKRHQTAARTARGRPVGPAGRVASAHSIDTLLSTAPAPSPPPVAVPTPARPSPYAAYPDWCAVPPPAGCVSPLLLARLAGGPGGGGGLSPAPGVGVGLSPAPGRPSPAHAAAGWYAAAHDYSHTRDEPLDLSMR